MSVMDNDEFKRALSKIMTALINMSAEERAIAQALVNQSARVLPTSDHKYRKRGEWTWKPKQS